MSIDKQRVQAVELLKRLGHRWNGTQWFSPGTTDNLATASDNMHALLMDRAWRLAGCLEDSDEEAELVAITDALETYEKQRWPSGKIEGGKG